MRALLSGAAHALTATNQLTSKQVSTVLRIYGLRDFEGRMAGYMLKRSGVRVNIIARGAFRFVGQRHAYNSSSLGSSFLRLLSLDTIP
jgi:conjugal transfer/entry exclusion protein